MTEEENNKLLDVINNQDVKIDDLEEEMADKQAEKYVMREDVITENDRVPFDNGYGFQTVSFEDEVKKGYKEGFLAGLKTGRPQWHKVADGDLPKAYQKCYFIYSNSYKDNKVVFSESNINVLTGLYAFYYDQETGEETTDPCFYDDINDEEISLLEVYAWKEIVLPKEIEK